MTSDSMNRPGRWQARLTGTPAAALILAAFWLLMLASLRDKGLTADEVVHPTAGYAYWRFNDYRLNPENGNLPQRIMALPLLRGFRFPPADTAAWRGSDEWAVGDQWFHAMGNDLSAMLARGRAASGLMAVALGALVWIWSRRLFGPLGGMVSLLLFVLSPTILANGALMTSDTACGLFFLAATMGWWAVLHRLSAPRVLASALVMGCLFVSKMSAVLILPIGLILAAARLADGRPLPVAIGTARELAGRGRQALAIALAAAVHIAVVLLVIWGFFGFRYGAFSGADKERARFNDTWEHLTDKPLMPAVLADLGLSPGQRAEVMRRIAEQRVPASRWTPESLQFMRGLKGTVLTPAQSRILDGEMSAPPAGAVPRLLALIDGHRLLPQAYVFGYAYSWKFAQKRGSFLNGRFGLFGWRWFFPYTVLVKTPLPVFGVILLAAGAAAAARRIHPRPVPGPGLLYATLPLWTLLAVYWAVLIPSHINIGHRHILATYPPLFILCGASAGWFALAEGGAGRAARAMRAALVALLALLAAEIAYRFPNYIAYFNAAAGGPERGYRHLVDSSLDWGQDLPGLRRYIAGHPGLGRTFLSYFGSDSPAYHRIPARLLYSLGKPVRMAEFPEGEEAARIAGLLQDHPDFEVAAAASRGGRERVMLLEKPRAFRLAAGTYFISATMLQPLEYDPPGPWGPWNARYEARYQELRRLAAPFLGDDPDARIAALGRGSVDGWMKTLNEFDQFRFARLTAFLRRREPDDTVNYSILVYRLTEADLARALDGPPPELGPDVLRILEAQAGVPGP